MISILIYLELSCMLSAKEHWDKKCYRQCFVFSYITITTTCIPTTYLYSAYYTV